MPETRKTWATVVQSSSTGLSIMYRQKDPDVIKGMTAIVMIFLAGLFLGLLI